MSWGKPPADRDAFGNKLAYNKRDPRAFGLLVTAPSIHADAVEHLAGRAATLSRPAAEAAARG